MEQPEYVRRLLETYRAAPGTAGVARRPDRLLAAQLHERGVPLETVANAMTLAAARRQARPADAPPLVTIRSLAYFSPAIGEVLQLRVSQEYFQHLRNRLQRTSTPRYPRLVPATTTPRRASSPSPHNNRTRLRRG